MLSVKKRLFIVTFTAAFLMGCQAGQPGSNQTSANTNANTGAAPATNSQSAAQPAAQTAGMPVTMPLIDAMFADQSFIQEAKQAVQMTDEEAAKVQDAARNAVLQLDGGEGSDDERSTRASVDKARTEIEKILGPQRTEQFFNFVRTRWGGGEALPSSKPNSVPTDTRIVVNAPAYRMDIFKDGRLLKTYRVGIGYPEFPLPTGLRRANEIIFNPTWTPPDEPWVKGEVQPGKTVEAGSKLNPLGPIKIPIGLPSLIHGGKNPSRLGTFASHGCVGLTSPMVQDFAVKLASISGTQLSQQDVENYEEQKTETKNVKLGQPIPVELRYETIVVEDGKISIYRDVYERGTNTEENLRRVLETHGVAFDSLPEPDRKRLLEAIEDMAVDATGNEVQPNANAGNSNSKNQSDKVTRNIKGKKEVVIELAALKGKGYPSPVDLANK